MAKQMFKFIIKTWLNYVARVNALPAELLRIQISRNFREQEKLLLAQLGRDFWEVESKCYVSKTLAKKAEAWREI